MAGAAPGLLLPEAILKAVSRVAEAPSVDPREAAHFERFAETWWDASGPFWPLHRLNALRVPWILKRACVHFGRRPDVESPLKGLDVLDIGCGGGILSESMVRLGANVLGIDVVSRNIDIARGHADQSGLEIDYELCSVEALVPAGRRFDIVLNMEVVEHVADFPGFMGAACAMLRPGGQMFVATINRNAIAWLFAIFGAEQVLRWLPRGTHHYRMLRKPAEVESLLGKAGLEVQDITGVKVNPLRKSLYLTGSTAVNYMLSAAAPAANSDNKAPAD